MHSTEFNAYKDALQALDESEGATLLDFGRYENELTYAQAAKSDPNWANWAETEPDARKKLKPFQDFLLRRRELVRPLGVFTKKEEQDLEKQRREAAEQAETIRKAAVERVNEERRVTLVERKRTSRGSQLIGLSDDINLFHLCILERLSLRDLLRIPCVCRMLQIGTSGCSDWPALVISAMVKRRAALNPQNGHQARHDSAVCRFFCIPLGWKMRSITQGANGAPLGVEDYRRLSHLAKLTGVGSYAMMRNEVRLSIQYWKKKRALFKTATDNMADNLGPLATKLFESSNRVKLAVGAIRSFHATHVIMTDSILFERDFLPSEVQDWERFSTDVKFAC
jgi:hypothetical protein